MRQHAQTDRTEFVEERTSLWVRLALPVYLIVAGPYFFWRASMIEPGTFWVTVPLYAVELLSALMLVLHLVLTRRVLTPVWRPPLAGRTVDAVIPTYNEPVDLVEMTTLGALAMRGVRDVLVLDDGRRAAMRVMCERVGAKYISRPDNSHAKAGNYNHGLRFTDAEFLVFLDCDHVPRSSFIERTLGYFRDPGLAFVQTPQVFSNFATSIQFRRRSFRRLWSENAIFWELVQPARNRFNAAFFCGSGAMFRRAALDDIGGFTTRTATEDIHTSVRIHAAGWRSVFLPEVLAFGLAPDDYRELHDQRVRWGAGALGLLFRTPDSPLWARGLMPWQRLGYFASTISFVYSGVIRLLLLLLPIALMVAVPLLPPADRVDLLTFQTVTPLYYLFTMVLLYNQSRRKQHPLLSEQFNLAVMPACVAAWKGVYHVRRKLKVAVKTKRAREGSSAMGLLVALAALAFTADVILGAFAARALDSASGSGTVYQLVPAFVWNSWNLVLLVSTVRYLTTFGRRPLPLHPWQPPQTPVRLDSGDRGLLRSIGQNGAVVAMEHRPGWSDVRLTIEGRHGPFTLPARITRRWLEGETRMIEVTFGWLSTGDRAALTQFVYDDVLPWHFAHDVIAPRRRSLRHRRAALPGAGLAGSAPSTSNR